VMSMSATGTAAARPLPLKTLRNDFIGTYPGGVCPLQANFRNLLKNWPDATGDQFFYCAGDNLWERHWVVV
jgi:hypothetical protein